ncbi:MAG: hypothetical protein ACYDAB_06885 [bacterium]
MSAATVAAEIRDAVTAGWGEPPEDLEGLAAAHRPPSRDMVKRLYANFDLYWTAGFLYFACRDVRAGREDWTRARRLLAGMAATCAGRLDLWNCAAAAAVLRKAASAIEDAQTTAEGLDVVDAVVLYLNRLQSWVDASIPWSALDAVAPLDIRGLKA